MTTYSDLSFDLAIGQGGNIKLVEDLDSIKQSIFTILTTRLKERWMNPEFGCNVWQYLFDPISDSTAIGIRLEIKRALSRWEPRIDLTQVIVEPYPDTNAYYVTVEYKILSVGREPDGASNTNLSIYKSGTQQLNIKLTADEG